MKADIEPLATLPNNRFVQWSTDNVDHSPATLDGKRASHGMGSIASVTPSGSIEQLKGIKRLKMRRFVSEVTKHKGVDIVEYDGSQDLNKFPLTKTFNEFESKEKMYL